MTYTAALIGANGAGKTTIMHSVCNLIPKQAGTVTFDGNGAVAVQVGGEAPEATEPAATEGNDAPEATEPVEGGEDKTEEGKSNGGLVTGIIISVVAVIAGAVAIFFVLKKK